MRAKRPKIETCMSECGSAISVWAEQTFTDGIHLADGKTKQGAYGKAAKRLRAMANECQRKARAIAAKRRGWEL